MERTTLGRTGLQVSRMGLGCGGPSRLGLRSGGSEADAERVVREALELGINFVDTAEVYGTESVVGRALRGVPRDRFVISTKVGVTLEDRPATVDETRSRIEACLKRLQMDSVDILHLHGVSASEYAYARDELRPLLETMRLEGKIRWIGITEAFGPDPGHAMLSRAVTEDEWDVVMVGFNLLNQSARPRVLEETRKRAIGTLGMFAVRRALSQKDALSDVISALVQQGLVYAEPLDPSDPLGFLTAKGVASGVTDAAYRFCRDEPGIDVVLSGTGNVDHLRENAASLEAPALPREITARLQALFARVDSISGN